MAETINKSFHQWIEARKQNDFSIFLPLLSELVVLKREEAHILGFDDHPYNALLNEHDKGSTVKLIDQVFNSIRTPLKNLLDQIQNQPQVEDKFLFSYYPKDKQWQFGLEMLRRLGYDFNAGRQDISEHPFSVSFNSNDVRITTRINENDLGSMTWSCIHELGHAFYEQGLPDIHYGLPLGEAISYTIHESQSRLWENHVGRSGVFCETWLPLFISYFPGQLKDVSPLDFFAAINKVNPSLIRTEADELTYHFHVMIRYELEKKLVEKSLEVADIPAYWNENYRQLLNVAVPDDLKGCLQDVHWSHGSFGYFPTYSLGSFYASQFYATATREIPLLEESLRKSDTRPLLHWLRNQIHRFGRMYTSEEMSVHITGEGLNVSHFIKYLTDKYRLIYKLPV
ncbi:MAG TPA: carboxypeptidase M32 [Flavitalea sp.]|nr:carboxypeptidase M32 [Flavitalea sp.]